MAKMLLVDDEMTMVQMIGDLLRKEGHQVVPFTDFIAAADCLGTVGLELIIAHLSREKNGPAALGILQKARGLNPPPLMILLTPSSPIPGALECLKRGAFDCLAKPFTPEDLKLRVQRALSYQAAVCENAALRRQLQSKTHLQEIVGCSSAIQETVRLIDRVADSDSSVLIRGPSGSGKQLVARTIHANSRRRFAPFVVVSCSSVPENLLEIELFGERKPPFGFGNVERLGVLREADGGTVLLNDMGALPLALQSRLLTFVQHGQIPADNGVVAADVRVLAAMTEPLHAAAGSIFSELYQRLSQICISLPPLHERAEDIPLLISHFLAAKIHSRSHLPCEISREAMNACRSYAWPGNVRELESALNHAWVLCQDGTINLSDLPLAIQQQGVASNLHSAGKRQNGERATLGQKTTTRRIDQEPAARLDSQDANNTQQLVPLKRYLRDQEISYLQRTLERVGGSKERAAEVLGISLATMYRKLSEPVEAATEPA